MAKEFGKAAMFGYQKSHVYRVDVCGVPYPVQRKLVQCFRVLFRSSILQLGNAVPDVLIQQLIKFFQVSFGGYLNK